MQLYVVTWKFQSSEDQIFATDAFVDYFESGKFDQTPEGYERISWVHMPQDGSGLVLCRALNASVLLKVFGPWREKYGMIWEYKPALTTEEYLQALKG